MTAYIQSDVEFYCASFDISEKFVASCPPENQDLNVFGQNHFHNFYEKSMDQGETQKNCLEWFIPQLILPLI